MRVAGCVLLLYGQHVTLRAHDVELHGPQVRLRLGDEPVEVAEPLAALLRVRATGAWLLPSANRARTSDPGASAAGCANSASDPRAALPALAASVPAPVLGELFGYCDDSADH